MNDYTNFIIETSLTKDEFHKKMLEISVTSEQLNQIQFKSRYKYKGILKNDSFELFDIYSSFKLPTAVFKGKIIVNENQKVTIDLVIENAGKSVLNSLIYALFLPLLYIINILMFIYNDSIIVNVISLFFSIILTIIAIRDNKKIKSNIREFEDFKKNILK